jgi:putative polyhydroxyalkanoate system protein
METTISHKLGKDEALSRVKARLTELKDEYDVSVKTSWRGSTLSFSGKGVTGTLKVQEDCVDIDADIPFLLRPFAGKAESMIKKELKAVLKA